MFRLIMTGFLVLAGAVYGSGSTLCSCPPSIGVFVNGVDYSTSFQAVTVVPGQTYTIGGNINNTTLDSEGVVHLAPAFQFSLGVTTHPDPDVDFGLDISGDPTVAIFITQTYLGSFPILKTDSSGQIYDLDRNGASVSGAPSFIQTTSINNIIANQTNTGCIVGSTPLTGTPCPPPTETFTPVGGQNTVRPNVLELDIQFTLSEGDRYVLNGSSALQTPVPEPATGPLCALFLAIAGFRWLQNRNRGRLA
jgi:hypothetical protein